MEKDSVAFIVGAGASAEFGLPIGNTLVDHIANLCDISFDSVANPTTNSNYPLAMAFRKLSESKENDFTLNQLRHDSLKIRSSMALAPSIDNYLDTHKDKISRVSVGKMAIALSISIAEKNSSLHFEPNNTSMEFDYSSLGDNWLIRLFRILVAQRNVQEFGEALSKTSFICFNYDRIIERFFFLATLQYFDLTEAETGKLLENSLNIVHPYGSIGKLRNSVVNSGFGPNLSSDGIVEAFGKIRTFTEGVEDVTVMQKISNTLSNADSIAFIGFAFHPLNIKILQSKNPTRCKLVLATVYGISEIDAVDIQSEVEVKIIQNQSHGYFAEAKKCSDFFGHFNRFLSR